MEQRQVQNYLLWAKSRGLVYPLIRDHDKSPSGEESDSAYFIKESGSNHPRVVFLTPIRNLEANFFAEQERALLIRMVKAIKLAFHEIHVCGVYDCESTDIKTASKSYSQQELAVHIQCLKPKAVVLFGKDLLPDFSSTILTIRTWHPAKLLCSLQKKKETWADLQEVVAIL